MINSFAYRIERVDLTHFPFWICLQLKTLKYLRRSIAYTASWYPASLPSHTWNSIHFADLVPIRQCRLREDTVRPDPKDTIVHSFS